MATFSNASRPGARSGWPASWAAFLLGALAILAASPMPRLMAQAPAEKAEAPAENAEPPLLPPAAEPEPEAGPADAPAADAPAEGAAPPAPKSMLRWFIEAAGPIGVFLLFISVYFMALVIRLFMEMRLTEAVPPPLVERLEVAIKEKKFQEAYDACRDSDSFLARLVRIGVANLPNGRSEAKEAMTGAAEEIVTGMEQKVGYLAIIGQLGPLIGLVGTVWGMILSFQEIATASGAQPRPEKVAEGISTALVITLMGVTLAVPAIFFYAFFRNRIAIITMESTRVADRVITSLVSAAKQARTT